MNMHDDAIGKAALKLAGTLQQTKDQWTRRLDDYFRELETLVEGEWFDSKDLIRLLHESRLASREALEGLGNDLSAILLSTSSDHFSRFEAERVTLLEEIADLRGAYSRAISGDKQSILRENQVLYETLLSVSMFTLLEIIQKQNTASYQALAKQSRTKRAAVQKMVRELMKLGFVTVDKKKRPHEVVFLSAPWRNIVPDESISNESDASLGTLTISPSW